MNNNEAKKTILEAESCFCKHGAYKDCHSGCKYREALDAAIKALEQEPTTKNDLGVDLISREQAKAAIRDKFKDLPSRVEINTILNELPSVTPQKPRWIPVSERLPEDGERVIVTYDKIVIRATWDLMRYSFYDTHAASLDKDFVYAWMPLPKPYEPQESEE